MAYKILSVIRGVAPFWTLQRIFKPWCSFDHFSEPARKPGKHCQFDSGIFKSNVFLSHVTTVCTIQRLHGPHR